MRIGEVAARVNVATSKIRFLEARGLVGSTRLPSGYRHYDEAVVVTLGTILRAQSLGFTLDEIAKAYTETADRETCSDYIGELLARKIIEVEAHIAEAQAFRLRLLDAACEIDKRRRAEERSAVAVRA